MRKKITLSIASILLLTGCSSLVNNEFKKNLKDDTKSAQDMNFSKYVKEKINKNYYIDFSVNKDLKSALNQLNQFDKNNIYILPSTQENIIFPSLSTYDSKKLHINNFYKLQKFVAQTTNYILKTKENPFKKGIKQVEVIDKNQAKNDIFNYPFKIHTKMTIKALLDEISKITHYSVIFKDNKITKKSVPNQNYTRQGGYSFSSLSSLKTPSFSANTVINFNGKTIGDLLTYLSNQFNYFVDIDYKNKLIIFKKYKTFTFDLLLPDNDVINSKSKSSVNSIADYTKNLMSQITSFIKDGEIKYKNGIVFAKVTKQGYETLSKFIKKINQDFSKEADIDVSIYVFALKKNIDLGSDFSFIQKDLSFITNYNSTYLFKKSLSSPNVNEKINANLNNGYLHFLNKFSYFYRITNKIPLTINFTKDRSYIKSIQATTTTSNATTTTIQTNIGNITEGQTITLVPNIYSNKVFLKLLFINQANEDLAEKNIGKDQVVMLPTNTKKTIPATANLRYGEKRIVGVFQSYVKYDSLQGLLPSDIPVVSRVVGNTKIKYVRELIAVVVSVKKSEF